MASRATRSATTSVAREEPGLHRQRVRYVRERPVHRALHLPDHAAPVVGDEVAGDVREVQRDSRHVRNLFPVCNENPLPGVRVLLSDQAPGFQTIRTMMARIAAVLA